MVDVEVAMDRVVAGLETRTPNAKE